MLVRRTFIVASLAKFQRGHSVREPEVRRCHGVFSASGGDAASGWVSDSDSDPGGDSFDSKGAAVGESDFATWRSFLFWRKCHAQAAVCAYSCIANCARCISSVNVGTENVYRCSVSAISARSQCSRSGVPPMPGGFQCIRGRRALGTAKFRRADRLISALNFELWRCELLELHQ